MSLKLDELIQILPESILILSELVSQAGGGRPCLPGHKPGTGGKLSGVVFRMS